MFELRLLYTILLFFSYLQDWKTGLGSTLLPKSKICLFPVKKGEKESPNEKGKKGRREELQPD